MIRKGIRLKSGQVWKITKSIKTKAEEINKVNLGREVRIVNIYGGHGLITVQDELTGARYDLKSINLSTLISNSTISRSP